MLARPFCWCGVKPLTETSTAPVKRDPPAEKMAKNRQNKQGIAATGGIYRQGLPFPSQKVVIITFGCRNRTEVGASASQVLIILFLFLTYAKIETSTST